MRGLHQCLFLSQGSPWMSSNEAVSHLLCPSLFPSLPPSHKTVFQNSWMACMAICCLPTWLSPTQGRGKRGIQMQQGCMPEEKASARGVSLLGHIQKPSGHCPGHPAPAGPVCAEGSDQLTSKGPFQPFCDTKNHPIQMLTEQAGSQKHLGEVSGLFDWFTAKFLLYPPKLSFLCTGCEMFF